ncbi:unnamed protein product [Ectocarpus sp. 8 AP-2014]
MLTSVGPVAMAVQKVLEVCLPKKNRENEAEAEDDCGPQQAVDEQRPNLVHVENSNTTSNRRRVMIAIGRLNRVLNSSTKMLIKMPRIHDLVLRLHSKDPDDDVAARNVVAARTAFDAAKDMWCAAKEALEAAIDDKKKNNGARNGGESNNALYEEEDAEERVTMAEQVFNVADRAFQSASKAFIETQKVVEEKKMVDCLKWSGERMGFEVMARTLGDGSFGREIVQPENLAASVPYRYAVCGWLQACLCQPRGLRPSMASMVNMLKCLKEDREPPPMAMLLYM